MSDLAGLQKKQRYKIVLREPYKIDYHAAVAVLLLLGELGPGLGGLRDQFLGLQAAVLLAEGAHKVEVAIIGHRTGLTALWPGSTPILPFGASRLSGLRTSRSPGLGTSRLLPWLGTGLPGLGTGPHRLGTGLLRRGTGVPGPALLAHGMVAHLIGSLGVLAINIHGIVLAGVIHIAVAILLLLAHFFPAPGTLLGEIHPTHGVSLLTELTHIVQKSIGRPRSHTHALAFHCFACHL